MDLLAHLDDGGLWLAAVVAGLTALGWFLRKTWRGIRRARRWWREVAKPFAVKAAVVLDLAEYELQHNGGGSIKDAAAMLPGIEVDVAALKKDVATLKEGDRVLREGAVLIAERAADMRQALADHVDQAASIHEEQGAAIAHLAEALPIIARSTPHADDAHEAHDADDSAA